MPSGPVDYNTSSAVDESYEKMFYNTHHPAHQRGEARQDPNREVGRVGGEKLTNPEGSR
eukprot:CAMPEP_0177656082 /NCGR_PEP_ID=MMETSP0447-20121125/15345_1 /TAXON_ID=0 /ORGANISM="Stygamoeba regulata, Strain BSH-02190019" /LENGTH=58 /DNA_ID=CAMNT_0019160113 /DNA_START=24 /DNA_END=200 /DNA_ORIENTATION=+